MAVQMELSRVVVADNTDQRALYLREVGGERTFVILVGTFEASVINRRLLEEPPFRPLTHELLRNLISALGASAQEVVVTDLKDHTYYAVLRLRQGDQVIDVDCRPSDAIALAVHYSPPLPIFVEDHVLLEAA